MSSTGEKKGFTSGMAVHATYGEDVPTVVKPFGRALVEVARKRSDIVGLTADVGKYTDIDLFAEEFPDRFFQIGMAEQNFVGVTSGLARVGFTPFATSYCSFAPRRAYDFIAIAIAEGEVNANLVMALPGITTGYGATHQGLEDVALMRAVPNMTVIDPCDATEIQQAVHAMADYEGPTYMRIVRGTVKQVFDPDTYQFELGKAKRLRTGSDVTLVSSGIVTDRALQAANRLADDGIDVSVVHASTLKPLDVETILEAVAETQAVVTLENHSVIGGLGAAVAEAIALEGLSVPFTKIGIPDRFLECGSVSYLTEKYGLSLDHVVKATKEVYARK